MLEAVRGAGEREEERTVAASLSASSGVVKGEGHGHFSSLGFLLAEGADSRKSEPVSARISTNEYYSPRC